MIAGGADSGDQQIGAGNLGRHGGAFLVFGKWNCRSARNISKTNTIAAARMTWVSSKGQQQRFGDLPSPSSNIPCRIPETCYLIKKP
ncbi:MAG: hypothetical protein WBH04_05000 [Albidovulum sp.]